MRFILLALSYLMLSTIIPTSQGANLVDTILNLPNATIFARFLVNSNNVTSDLTSVTNDWTIFVPT